MEKIDLVEVEENIWIVDGDCVNFYGFAYPTRMVVIRLKCGSLWIWSPIEYSEDIGKLLMPLGPVTHLVSPNKIHHLFLSQWHEVYPVAKLWGPQSTIQKRKDLVFQPALVDHSPKEWKDELDQIWFNGSFSMDEIVFFHRSSSTIILADLSENFSETFLLARWKPWQRSLARMWGIVEGKGFAPLEWRLSFIKRRATRKAIAEMRSKQPERVVMAHGEWQRENGKAYLEQSFAWLI